MSAPLHELPVHHWVCPNCPRESITRELVARPRLHACAGLLGTQAPMVPKGSGARVFTREREDYIGAEQVFLDVNGRPIMSVITERPDGSNDTAVFAPTATARGSAH